MHLQLADWRQAPSLGSKPNRVQQEPLYSRWRAAAALAGSWVQGDKLHKRTGTPLYLAPELFMQYYGLESDLWALGILLYQVWLLSALA